MMKEQVTLTNRRGIDALKKCCLALVCCALLATFVPAQSISGRITGTITDQTGAVISRATVTVTNEGTGAQRRATADENGLYVAPELPVGFYTLKVEGGNFAPATKTRIKVDVGAETRVDVTLTPQ